MQLQEIQNILCAEVVCNDYMLENEICCVCGSDLMSDVLAFTKEKTLILTGLMNVQTIRTAEMSDAAGIVFVRGKRPSIEVLALAKASNIPIMITNYPMYEACGLLYKNGLAGCSPNRSK